MADKLNFPTADRDVFIQGDGAIKRTINLGQNTLASKDDVVIASENWSVSAAGVSTWVGNATFNGGLTAPKSGSTNVERFGEGAAAAAVSAFALTVFGKDCGLNVTTGDNNAFYGFNAGAGVSTASQCASFGVQSMTAANASNQTAFGYGAMRFSNGENNNAFGSLALAGSAITTHTGQFNTAFGAFCLQSVQGAGTWNNAGFGGRSLENLTTGVGNNCFGKDTGRLLTSGGNNCFFGNGTGDSATTASSCILLGSGLDTTAVDTVGELKIHFAGGSNVPIISGDMVVGKLGINTETHDATLNVKTDDGDNIDTLELDQNDNGQALVSVEATSAAGTSTPLSTFTLGATIQGFMKIRVNGTEQWIALYDDPTS